MRLCSAYRALLLGAMCVRAASAAATAPPPPPYEGVYQPRGVDEIGWWHEDDEAERNLVASNLIIRDEKLTSYLKTVLCNTVGQDRCKSVRVYIMREPTSNASMSPNGTMRVLSGLLLRVHNESELAYVLGHEFGHFEHRHFLERFKATRSGTDILAWGAVLVSLAPSYSARRSYQNLELSVYGNLFRYGRDQEREADFLGIGYLNKSGLRSQSASIVWQNIMAEAEASSLARGLKRPNFNSIAFTASHPPNAERATYLKQLAAPDAANLDDGAERYRTAIAPWLPRFLEDQIKVNDFGGSEYIIESLAKTGWTADLWFARGELYRARGNPRDLVNAAEFYSRSIALLPTIAEAHRGLGLALIKTGQTVQGQNSLKKYLELKPAALDASMIRMMLPNEVTKN